MNKRIAIIIVGYNSKKYLNDLFTSLNKSTYKNFKIFYVDNNSADQSINWIQNHYPKTEIIKNKDNVGFATANNIGLKIAIKQNFNYFFLLNPDTVIDKNCLQILIDKVDNNSIIQPLILIYKNKKTNLINSDGNVLNYLGYSYCAGQKKNADNIQLSRKEIPLASGAAMFIPKNIINSIGILDDDFFMYHEDVDFSWRARIAGFKIKIIPDAIVWHKYHFSRNKQKFFFAERNRLFFIFKNFQAKTILLISPMFLINEILMVLYSIFTGWFLLKIKSSGSFIWNLNYIFSKRKKINKLRKNNDQDLKRYFSSEIEFSEVKIPALKIYNLVNKGYWWLVRKLI
jgi:GT2 family glycosyltransferase